MIAGPTGLAFARTSCYLVGAVTAGRGAANSEAGGEGEERPLLEAPARDFYDMIESPLRGQTGPPGMCGGSTHDRAAHAARRRLGVGRGKRVHIMGEPPSRFIGS